jgi:hypothetical protein
MKFNQHSLVFMIKWLILFWNEYFRHKSFNMDVQKIDKSLRSLTKSYKTITSCLSVLIKTKWTRLFAFTFLRITSAQITNDC